MAAHPFRAAIEARDHAGVVATFAPDVSLHSPVTFRPFEGRDAAGMVIAAIFEVFEDFRYTGELSGDDVLALTFEARVGDRELEGIDLLRFDENGLIGDLTVMVRPLSATLAVRDAMAQRLGRA